MIFTPVTAPLPAFTPKSLIVTFETAEEFRIFRHMLSWNVSIPELVANKNGCGSEVLTKSMNEFRVAMDNIK